VTAVTAGFFATRSGRWGFLPLALALGLLIAGPIEADEILDLHLLLKDFEGSLDDLLKAPHRSR
jgi:hypothetical protein